jgi:hypothetical protein
MISWSQVVGKAIEAGVEYSEISIFGHLAGYKIGQREVRHGGTGWFNKDQVDEAIKAAAGA